MIAVETMVSGLEAGDSRRHAATRFQNDGFPMLTGTLVMIAGFIPVGFAPPAPVNTAFPCLRWCSSPCSAPGLSRSCFRR
jgi:hypothetical protein